MPAVSSHQVVVAAQVLLDGRLALFHEEERWLAVADLHFGYELSQRAAGRLMPLWGMASIEERLMELLDDYEPRQLIIVGDLVHDKASGAAAAELLRRLRRRCQVIALAGNHDRHLGGVIEFQPRWETPEFVFQHGDGALDEGRRIQIIGHHHPAASITDGAGLRLKFPAFIQCVGRASSLPDAKIGRLEARPTGSCWILPAFSPWAGGVVWADDDGASRIWLCTPRRVFRVRPTLST